MKPPIPLTGLAASMFSDRWRPEPGPDQRREQQIWSAGWETDNDTSDLTASPQTKSDLTASFLTQKWAYGNMISMGAHEGGDNDDCMGGQ